MWIIPMKRIVNVAVYDFRVVFITDEKNWRKYFKDDPMDCDGLARRCYNEITEETVFFVGVFNNRLSTLVHEINHICFFLLAHVGVPVEPGAPNEAFCYLSGYLFNESCTLIAK